MKKVGDAPTLIISQVYIGIPSPGYVFYNTLLILFLMFLNLHYAVFLCILTNYNYKVFPKFLNVKPLLNYSVRLKIILKSNTYHLIQRSQNTT